jgi:hypothetical protein
MMILFRTFFMLLAFTAISAHAQFDDSAFKQALHVKKDVYITEGGVSGGDRNSSDFRVNQVRVAANPAGYDRVVIEMKGNDGGEKSALSRPPFYIVDVKKKKIDITVFGKPKLEFSTQSVIQAAKKTKTIARVDFIPIVSADRWTWSIETQVPVKTEVFELTDPARIIIDLKK